MKIGKILLFLITLILFGCVKEKVYDVKVVRATDSRYPSLNDEEFGLVLEKTKKIMRTNFNIEIGYSYIGEEGMSDFFDKYSVRVPNPEKRFWEKRRCNIFSPDIKRFRADIFNYLKKYELDRLKEFLSEEEKGIKTYEEATERVMEIYERKLNLINKELDPSRPEIYSYTQWLLLVRHRGDFNLIFINTPFIDDLLFDPVIHTLVRGGITCGFIDDVNSGPKNEWGGVFTTFPFLSKIEFLKSERDRNYPEAQKERLQIIAYQMCHELAHLLLEYDDAYDHPNCILNPPKVLRYKIWYDGIVKAGKCPKKHKKFE
ncbi:hypothetical protein KJ640_04890 [bacterium]|nr:hypothetical protein [bacterium]